MDVCIIFEHNISFKDVSLLIVFLQDYSLENFALWTKEPLQNGKLSPSHIVEHI